MKDFGRVVYFIALNEYGDKVVCSQLAQSPVYVGQKYSTSDVAKNSIKHVSKEKLVKAPLNKNIVLQKKDIHMNIMARFNDPEMSKDEILRYVCSSLSVTIEEVLSRSRKREIVDARKIFSWVTSKATKNGPSEIGRTLKKPHDLIIYYIKDLEELISVEPLQRIRVYGILKNMPMLFVKDTSN